MKNYELRIVDHYEPNIARKTPAKFCGNIATCGQRPHIVSQQKASTFGWRFDFYDVCIANTREVKTANE